MADNYQRADKLNTFFVPTGGVQATLGVKGWNFDDSNALYDVTNTKHTGRGTARIAGKGDASGNVTAFHDADSPNYLTPPNINKGVNGVLIQELAPGKAIQQPIIIEKVHYEGAVDSEVRWNFDWKENIIAGFKVYPAS